MSILAEMVVKTAQHGDHHGDEQRRFRRHPSEIAGWAGEKAQNVTALNDYAVSQLCGWLFYMGHLAIESAFRSPGDDKQY